MYQVLNKKAKVIMVAKTLEAVMHGMATGCYKCGEYTIIAPDGKATTLIQYRH